MATIDSHGYELGQLFSRLAEQVKLPFIKVLQAAEMMGDNHELTHQGQQTIQEVSQAALQLIDGYLLQVRLQEESQLRLEPVSISSILYDTAELLKPYARLYNCEIKIEVFGRYGPVMSHANGLKAALANIGYSLIDAAGSNEHNRIVTLGVRRNRKGISTGVYAEDIELSPILFRQAKEIKSTVHQPLVGFSSTNAAGVFVADGLLGSLGAPLRVARLGGKTGLAATFLPSRQLSLV